MYYIDLQNNVFEYIYLKMLFFPCGEKLNFFSIITYHMILQKAF